MKIKSHSWSDHIDKTNDKASHTAINQVVNSMPGKPVRYEFSNIIGEVITAKIIKKDDNHMIETTMKITDDNIKKRIRNQSLRGMGIGGRVLNSETDEKGIYHIKNMKLIYTSIVDNPGHPDWCIKGILEDDEEDTPTNPTNL